MPRLPEKQTEVERARRELERTNELIAQVKTEIRVLEKRRGEIRVEVEEDNRQLRLQREQDAAEVAKNLKATLAPLEAQRTDLRNEISKLVQTKQDIETELIGAQGELPAIRQQASRAQTEADLAQERKEKLEAQAVGVTAKITNLSGQIQPLKEELVGLRDEIGGLEQRKEDLGWELSALDASLTSQKTQLEREITELQHKRREVGSSLNEEMKQFENTRTALAEWESKLMKREKIVKAREYKAAIAEDKIATNAELLNL